MKENKTTMIVLGCVGVLCLCAVGAGVLGLGLQFYGNADTLAGPAQATIAPEDIPTRLPATTPTASAGSAQPTDVPDELPQPVPESDASTGINDLDHIAVLPFSYSDDDDEANEGVAVDIVFYDANEEVITFSGTPINITMEFYAFTDFLNSSDIASGDLVYTETVMRDHSSTLEEMFDNYIRIPYAEMNVDQNKYVRFGSVRVIVDAPNGSHEATSTLVILYPEQ